ncbi:hypothetical protein SEA_ARGAN_8 [Arthrobacter phage Argan]|nr:hypothetical protein SEA_ARGAN_8 [Arthrobacter phage Argan]
MAQEVDEFLAHYGVVGMKWGKRHGGLKERAKGSINDSFQRQIQANKAVAEGRGQIRDYAGTFGRKGVGLTKGRAAANVKVLEERQKRLNSGKAKFLDKVDAFNRVKITDMVVSRQDKRGLEGATKDKVNSGKAKAAKILAGAAAATAIAVATSQAKNAAQKGAMAGANKAFNSAYEKKKAQNNYNRNKPAYDRAADTRGISNFSTVRMNYNASNNTWE